MVFRRANPFGIDTVNAKEHGKMEVFMYLGASLDMFVIFALKTSICTVLVHILRDARASDQHARGQSRREVEVRIW